MIEQISDTIEILGATKKFQVAMTLNSENDGVSIYDIHFKGSSKFEPNPVTFRWKVPAINVKGVWKPTTDFAKRIMADWELTPMESRISVDSPVISLFGHDDDNAITFACADAINTTQLNALYREEDNHIYCHISFFTERHASISDYHTQVRIDQRKIHFSQALADISNWWSSFDTLKPLSTPSLAKVPVYSTWYQFHQKLDPTVLLDEAKIATQLGYDLMILDDGWQTFDENRGYDYTGDWQPDRFPDMQGFVREIHQTGMKLALWYSVPFCGHKSKAYNKFKGKFLTEEHRWAPVLDPRYPEIRTYLIDLYTKALKDWKIDGFKLDFIDEFKVYPSTVLTKENGRDYSSVNLAVDRLMTDIINSLHAINPEIVIEFRQKYTGPAMRKYGTMFRAFDCPGDATMNRVRIVDLKMLCSTTAVHSDMFTYHEDEPLELKALQLVNTLFGVPQLSVVLQHASSEELAMIKFYTHYWKKNAAVFLEGSFLPQAPLANYPLLKSATDQLSIIGVFDNYIINFEENTPRIDIINGHHETSIVVKSARDFGIYNSVIFNCMGQEIQKVKITINKGTTIIDVPVCGMIQLTKENVS